MASILSLRKFISLSSGEYVFHGTSSLYVEYLLRYGFNGMYPDELYQSLKLYYRLIPQQNRISDFKVYIVEFFKRQENIRKSPGEIDISLTNDYSQAIEYANTARCNGEGPGYIIELIRHNYEIVKSILKIEDSIRELDRFLKKFEGHIGIVLCFRKSELLELVPDEDGGFTAEQFGRPVEHGGRILFKYAIPPRMIYLGIQQEENPDRIRILKLDKGEAQTYISNKKKASAPLACISHHRGGLRVKHKTIKNQNQKQKRKRKTKKNKIQ